MLIPLTGDDEPTPDHLAFKLSFDKARRRTPSNWQEFAPQIVRLIDDEWSAEPVDRTQPTNDHKSLTDKKAAMFDAIKASLARHGSPQKTEEAGKEHIAVDRKAVRKQLVEAGWFSEDQLSTAFKEGEEIGKPTRAALTDENNMYRSLKTKRIIDFNRDHVWRR